MTFLVDSFTPKHQYLYSPNSFLYIALGADKKNLFNNHQRLKLVIISFILLTHLQVKALNAVLKSTENKAIISRFGAIMKQWILDIPKGAITLQLLKSGTGN